MLAFSAISLSALATFFRKSSLFYIFRLRKNTLYFSMYDYTQRYLDLKKGIDQRLESVINRDKPNSLYTPAQYILEGGGKRIRPILVLLACEAVGGCVDDAYNAGVSVEILHNFTLVHDDIMDNASNRRGRSTVHTKWDTNTAILVGDELIGIAYKTLLRTMKGDIREIINVFTDGMIEVCEGQSYDKEFEVRGVISDEEYLMMIAKKTGRLVSMSAEIGALIGEASEQEKHALIDYASFIGRAFQVQDDLLDIVANEEEFGKMIGGDILEGKKTYLLVKALRHAKNGELELLRAVAEKSDVSGDIVARVRDLYHSLGVIDMARDQIREDTDRALACLNALSESEARRMLVWFAEMLLRRSY